jgi:hypothetical protein
MSASGHVTITRKPSRRSISRQRVRRAQRVSGVLAADSGVGCRFDLLVGAQLPKGPAMRNHGLLRSSVRSVLGAVPVSDIQSRLALVGLSLLVLGVLFPTGAARAKSSVEISAQAGSSGSTASISVDIDEPTKPGPDGETGVPTGPIPGLPQGALQDTVWIADWSFNGGSCVSTGWTHYDNRILNDSSNYWSVNSNFSGTGGIVNNAAVLAKHDLSWVRDGYGNNWDYSIILKYQGNSSLSFDTLSDSEPGADFVTVEADSAGASESLVNYAANPGAAPEQFRTVLLMVDGLQNASTGPIALPDFGVPATLHEVYIRFHSDAENSDEDGSYGTAWNAGLVVDNIAVSGSLTYSENFESSLNANISLTNTAPAIPFGEWARLYQHITDNDKCTENTTCAWLFSDPSRFAFFPNMAFGPGGAVLRNWLDNVLVSPWVSLASTPSATSTILTYRTFPGNRFALGKIVLGWQVRSKIRLDNTDTSTIGDSIDAVTAWQHTSRFSTLTRFSWVTALADISGQFPGGASEVQIRFRIGDWQYLAGDEPPVTLNTGPGPYLDRVRIGRQVLTGPVMDIGTDSRSQAQDAFATVQNAISPGEHFSPATDVFGTCAFSPGAELGINASSPNLITGDSIVMRAVDVRGAGGITAVRWYGAITTGPHAGKAPAPYTVGGNGFFEVTPDSSRNASGSVVSNQWAVDLDDTYFRGGDQLLHFWTAVDASGGRSSSPRGFTSANFPPASVAAAELTTGGLYEVSYLPAINWSPTYLARIAADAHGDLDPTPTEIASSSQHNCVLYYNQMAFRRRSGDAHRTSFMYTLDRLGYRGHYDVYDVQGFGNTNNQLAGRANVSQASGYALIIEDDGRLTDFVVPDGLDLDGEKIDQAQWYRDWLSQGLTGAAGIANLWLVGENAAYEKRGNPLFSTDMGLASIQDDQGLAANPSVHGISSFTFTNGNIGSFIGDIFTLAGGCPALRAYDGAASTGTAVITHRYVFGATTGLGAVIMNKNNTLKWNTVWMGFPWFDIRDAFNANPVSATGAPDVRFAKKILDAVLPIGCVQALNPTDAGDPEAETVPGVSALYANVPNPFNPTTRIDFDLARDGHVRLRVFDVAGRLVRTLVDEDMHQGFRQSVTWNGLDENGLRVSSGVYLYRLEAGDFMATRKLVVLK